MYDISDRMREILRGQYQSWLRVKVLDHDRKVLVSDLPVESGSITWDLRGTGGAARGQLVVPDLAYVPTSPASPLAPFGHRLDIKVGVSNELGSQKEFVNYEQFVITTTKVSRGQGRDKITVDFLDLAWLANEMVLLLTKDTDEKQERVYKQGSSLRAIIDKLMTDALGHKVSVDGAGDIKLKRDIRYPRGTTYWAIIKDLCDRHNHNVTTMGNGGLRLSDRGDGGTVADEIAVGKEVLTLDSEVNRLAVKNKIVVVHKGSIKRRISGEIETIPVTYVGQATITEGPLRWGGPLGRLPLVREESPTRPSQDSANDKASSLLRWQEGLSRSLRAECIWLPHLQVGDFVEIDFGRDAQSGRRLGVEEERIKAITHSLTPAQSGVNTVVEFEWDERASLKTKSAQRDSFQVASYNQPSRFFQNKQQREDEIERIFKAGATIIGLQEQPDPQEPKGWQVYQPDGVPNPVMWHKGTWGYIRGDTFKINDKTDVKYPGAPGATTVGPRWIVYVTLKNLETGKEIIFGNMHGVAYWLVNPKRAPIHRQQIDRAAEWLSRSTANLPRILVGDFNAQYGGDALAPLRRVARGHHVQTHGPGQIDILWVARDHLQIGTGRALTGYRSDHKPMLGRFGYEYSKQSSQAGGGVEIGPMMVDTMDPDFLIGERWHALD